MHFRLLVQLTEHYYTARLHERELERSARLQAVHEAGARLTHDIKNLLQALQTLLSVLSGGSLEEGQEAALRLQVEEINKRLRLVLDKLGAPESTTPMSGTLRQWWMELQRRYAGVPVEFKDCLRAEPGVPVELLDSVAGNLLENARRKQQMDPRVRVWVSLEADEVRYKLSVCDSGAAIPQRRPRTCCTVLCLPTRAWALGFTRPLARRSCCIASYACSAIRQAGFALS